jgi:hypothetical protein
MIGSSRTDDAMARMRAANPCSLEDLGQTMSEADLERAMRRAIAAGEAPTRLVPAGDRVAMERGAGGGPGRAGIVSRRRVATAGFGLACAGVIAVLVILGGGSVDSVKDGGRPTYAAAAVKVAEANPRLLVTAPGWSIIHANFGIDDGGLTYAHAGRPAYGPDGERVTLNWVPAGLYRDALRGHRGEGPAESTTVLGHRATTFHAFGGSADITILPPQGKVFVEVSASPRDNATVLGSLRAVGVDRWLAAMPPEVVQPVDRSGLVAGMLDGVPLPPGFDATKFESETGPIDHYQFGQAVAGAVACGWLESWSAARQSGDEATARQAVEGMAGVRRWPVLLQMVQEKGFKGNELPAHGGGWPSYLVEASREIAAGHLRRTPAVKRTYVHGGALYGVSTPRDAAPVSVLDCHLGG